VLPIAATAELILHRDGYECRLSRLLDSKSLSDFYRQFVAILMQNPKYAPYLKDPLSQYPFFASRFYVYRIRGEDDVAGKLLSVVAFVSDGVSRVDY